eukprot:644981-Pyramimonas_sp.AAC.1
MFFLNQAPRARAQDGIQDGIFIGLRECPKTTPRPERKRFLGLQLLCFHESSHGKSYGTDFSETASHAHRGHTKSTQATKP